MKLTINEIAKIAQVAKSTVSKALNGQKGVSDEQRQRILSLAAQLKYEPSASAQALAFNKTGSIGLLVPHEVGYSLSGSYWSSIITSISQAANGQNYSLLILTPTGDEGVSSCVESVIRRRNVDGLIIGAGPLDPTVTNRLMAEGIPFVFIGENPIVGQYSVDVDNEGGSERLVTHLVNAGYRKIACLAGPSDYLYNKQRVAGYEKALKKANIDWLVITHSTYVSGASRETMALLLREHSDLDALYVTAGGDFIFDCIDILSKSGINLKKFGFGVFDDYRFFDYMDLPICAIRQPLIEIGSAAAHILFAFLAGNTPKIRNTILEVELILR